ncbi:FmdB family zinc ribbon protein [Candidatus Nitrospira bockiana]
MPIYEYLCQSCSHRFEVKQKFDDPPLSTCTRCGQPVQKLISAPAIMFKGSGWYITDYSDKLKAPTSETPSGNGAKDASGNGAKEPKTTSSDGTAAASSAAPPSGGSEASKSSSSTPSPAASS